MTTPTLFQAAMILVGLIVTVLAVIAKVGSRSVRMPAFVLVVGMGTWPPWTSAASCCGSKVRVWCAAVTMLSRRAVELHALAVGRLDVTDPAVAAVALGESPVFPNSKGGWRDPSNTLREIRKARGEDFAWVASHVFRKTAATMLDQAGLTARQIADVLGHAQISMTQDRYLSRAAVDPDAALALESGLCGLFTMHKPCMDLVDDSQDTA